MPLTQSMAMTIRAPKSIVDKLLSVLGKERNIALPNDADKIHEKYGPYVSMTARKEGFFKTLFKRNKTSHK